MRAAGVSHNVRVIAISDRTILRTGQDRYIPDPQHAFTLTKGTRAELTRYTFNTGVVAHMFCPTCGCGLFAEARGAAKTVVGGQRAHYK